MKISLMVAVFVHDVKYVHQSLFNCLLVARPYNGDWSYWSARRGTYPGIPTREAKLLKKQKGRCSHCGLYFKDTDIVEVDHIIPKSLGGKDADSNYQLLHRHCHDTKTATDGSMHSKECAKT